MIRPEPEHKPFQIPPFYSFPHLQQSQIPAFKEGINTQAIPKEVPQLLLPYLVIPQPDGTSIIQPIQTFNQVLFCKIFEII